LANLPALLEEEGVTTPFQADFTAGSYSVTVSLVDISKGQEVELGSGTKEFNVGYAATLSVEEPNLEVIGTVGWTRFAGTVKVAEGVEGIKAYYIFEIEGEGKLAEDTVPQYWDYQAKSWKDFAVVEVEEGENAKYRFGPSGGFDLAEVAHGPQTEFQAKIADGESITGKAYLVDAENPEVIISNVVDATITADPFLPVSFEVAGFDEMATGENEVIITVKAEEGAIEEEQLVRYRLTLTDSDNKPVEGVTAISGWNVKVVTGEDGIAYFGAKGHTQDDDGYLIEDEEAYGFPFGDIKEAAEGDGYVSAFTVSELPAGEGYTLLIEMAKWDREVNDAGAVLGAKTVELDVEALVFNGSVSGVIDTDENGVVTGTLTGDFEVEISGQVTEYDENEATFTGTVTGDINGQIEATINANGIDTLSGTVTGTGAVELVRVIGIFPQSGTTGDFVGQVITGSEPTYVENMSIKTPNDASTVTVGGTLQMEVEVSPGDASNEVIWSVWTAEGQSTDVATIDKDTGLLTGVKPGKVTVIAKALDGSLADATKTITVTGEEEATEEVNEEEITEETTVTIYETQFNVDEEVIEEVEIEPIEVTDELPVEGEEKVVEETDNVEETGEENQETPVVKEDN
jgi:hypothetical protein